MKIVKIIIIVLVGLVAFEWVSGFISKDNAIRIDFVNQEYADQSDGYFKPNIRQTVLFPGLAPYKLTTNALGYRDTGVEITRESIEGKKKILTVGDSYTISVSVDDEDSYPYFLQKKFTDTGRDDVVVLNAGLGDITISDYFYYLTEKLPDIQPDYLIMSICWNDIQSANKNKPKYQQLLGIEKDPLAIEFRKLNFARLFLPLYAEWKFRRWTYKEKDDRVKEIFTKNLKDFDSLMYAYGNHRVSDVVYNPHSEELKDDWEEYFKVLGETIELIQSYDIPLLVWISPEFASLYEITKGSHELKIFAFLDSKGVKFVDVLPTFKKHKEDYLKVYANPPRDFHLGSFGNDLLAEDIFSVVKSEI